MAFLISRLFFNFDYYIEKELFKLYLSAMNI